MGGSQSTEKATLRNLNNKLSNAKNFHTMDEVQDALREAGLESSNLLIGVDYTKSNTWTGKRSFNGYSLHTIFQNGMNPYQKVIDIIGRTLEPFDDDKLIPVYGFGDVTTTDRSVFSFMPNDQPCDGFQQVLQRYNEITPSVKMSGPTNFAPLIRKAIEIVKGTRQYHILLIIADGQVDAEKATKAAIVEASHYPLSIICIGVGDGPFDMMDRFDNELDGSRFDNFNFVEMNKVLGPRVENPDIKFAVTALQEIPVQYALCKKLGYFNN